MLRVSLFLVCTIFVFCQADYWSDRDELIKSEESQMMGSSIELDEYEKSANDIIMKFKLMEHDEGFKNPRLYLASRHIFEVRDEIRKSEIFKILRLMPKGAALHSHDVVLVSEDYLYELTFRSNLYACPNEERLRLKFLSSPEKDKACNWTSLETLRSQNSSYDGWVRSQLTLNVEDPKEVYPDANVVWQAMRNIFATVRPMVTYRPVFEDTFYEALQELYNDNVFYLEFRGDLPTVYELNGTTYNKLEVVQIYQNVIQKFKETHPDFVGARLIYAPLRHPGILNIQREVEFIKELKEKFPHLLAGFDLVGQEDLGWPLKDVINYLQEIPRNIDFYFHSGETNWFGATDTNLIDAVLLGTKRIGHGYGLTKHPELMKIVKERNIAIEVNPISNQVLMLVEDLRNHPATILISQGFPVVVSYDDPSCWSVEGLSYDFYMAFMGIASRNADLKFLKQLALNSLQYSSLPEDDKKVAITSWEAKWKEFIEKIIAKYPKNQ